MAKTEYEIATLMKMDANKSKKRIKKWLHGSTGKEEFDRAREMKRNTRSITGNKQNGDKDV